MKLQEATGLFFEWNEFNDEEDIKILKEVEMDDNSSIKDIVEEIIKLCNYGSFDCYKNTKDTRGCLYHWGFINGVTEEIII